MKLDDYILISRNNRLYKAQFCSLSSVIGFVFAKNQVSSYLDDLSVSIEDCVTNFSDSHYTKTEMKSDFCTISSINSLTANATYALTSLASETLSSLSSKNEVDEWYLRQLEQCANVFTTEFSHIKRIMKSEPPEPPAHIYDYAQAPEEIEDLMESDDGTLDADAHYT